MGNHDNVAGGDTSAEESGKSQISGISIVPLSERQLSAKNLHRKNNRGKHLSAICEFRIMLSLFQREVSDFEEK
ncbi:unnamed protein product [Ceratitis capitata]|uniref:(Mediterranean fruit fly) hypothetical protein n=1 Tax=Ceratitis capitata TaxID=7213 RepID=A0A811TZ87_CERCA|nr:unnamed protein product [Ceratitis capitata]